MTIFDYFERYLDTVVHLFRNKMFTFRSLITPHSLWSLAAETSSRDFSKLFIISDNSHFHDEVKITCIFVLDDEDVFDVWMQIF